MNELEFPFEMPVTRYRMKKLSQSAGAKAQNSRQRKQRRNYQVGGTKKRSVFLPVPGKKSEPENSVMVESCAPKGKPRKAASETEAWAAEFAEQADGGAERQDLRLCR